MLDKVQDRDFKVYCEALLGKSWHDSERLRKFVEFNGMIFKFSCYWDDQKSVKGEINDYTILYYLEDDTIQIVEVRKPNSGKFYFSTLQVSTTFTENVLRRLFVLLKKKKSSR